MEIAGHDIWLLHWFGCHLPRSTPSGFSYPLFIRQMCHWRVSTGVTIPSSSTTLIMRIVTSTSCWQPQKAAAVARGTPASTGVPLWKTD